MSSFIEEALSLVFKAFKSLALCTVLTTVSLFTSGTSYAAQTSKTCPTDLALLNSAIIEVLNDFASMIVENQNADTESAAALIAHESLLKKFASFEALLKDEALKTAAERYVRDQVVRLTHANIYEKEKLDAATEEAQRQEHLRFGTYVPAEKIYKLSRQSTDVTPDGDVVELTFGPSKFTFATGHKTDLLLSFKNIFDDSEKILKLPEGIRTHWRFKYDHLHRKVYFVTQEGLNVIDIPEAFDKNSLAEIKPVFSVTDPKVSQSTKAKIETAFASINRPFVFNDMEYGELTQTLRSSQDALTFAGIINKTIVVYHVLTDSFTAIRNLGFSHDNLNNHDWALSPDGKYVALGTRALSDWPARVYDTAEGHLIKSFSVITDAVGFSNDGQWLIANNGPYKAVMKSIFQDLPEREFEYPNTQDLVHRDGYFEEFIFSPDDLKVVGIHGKTMAIWDSAGHFLQKLSLISGHLEKTMFVEGSQYLLSFTGSDLLVSVLTSRTKSPSGPVQIVRNHPGRKKPGA